MLISCNDSIRSRSTISQQKTSGTEKYQANLKPEAGTVINEFINGESVSFKFEEDTIEAIKNPFSSFRKIIFLKVDGSNIYKLVETKISGSAAINRKVVLESVDLNSEIIDLKRKGLAEVTGSKLLINMNLSRNQLQEGQSVNNQMVHYQTQSNYQAVFNLNSPHCEYRTTLVTTTELILDGAVADTAETEETQHGQCGNMMSLDDLKRIDLTAIQFCDNRTKTQKCTLMNLNNLVE